MVDWLTATARHFAREPGSAPGPREQVCPTYMVVLPNGMPAHSSDEVTWHMAGSHCKMALEGQEVISDWAVDIGQHVMRWKLEEWGGVMVSWPQQQPSIIVGPQVPVGTHGPPLAPVKAHTQTEGPDLLHRGSAPWEGGTVMICSQC